MKIERRIQTLRSLPRASFLSDEVVSIVIEKDGRSSDGDFCCHGVAWAAKASKVRVPKGVGLKETAERYDSLLNAPRPLVRIDRLPVHRERLRELPVGRECELLHAAEVFAFVVARNAAHRVLSAPCEHQAEDHNCEKKRGASHGWIYGTLKADGSVFGGQVNSHAPASRRPRINFRRRIAAIEITAPIRGRFVDAICATT